MAKLIIRSRLWVRKTLPMSIHVLSRSQVIRTTPEECWKFFSDPKNLATITPQSLNLVVLSELPSRMYAGLMVRYRVRPILGIPVTWLTEITQVNEPYYFVDEQRVGPYRIWHHEHTFTPLPDGRMEVRDCVHYVLPFAPLGDVLHPLIVRPRLQTIFDFREQAIREYFKTD